MAVERVDFYVLDVGQGSLNYVEIVEDVFGKSVVTHNMLIDIGTDSTHVIAKENIQWLRDKIKDRPDPRIDVVTLTHGDTDHYSLLLSLLPALKDPELGRKGRIGMIRYGGDEADFTKGKPLSELKNYCVDINGFDVYAYGVSEDGIGWEAPIWPKDPGSSEVALRLSAGNLPVLSKGGDVVSNPKDDARKNTGSLMVAVYWDGYWVLCTGDATGSSLAGANDIYTGATGVPKTFMMTAPHHGSRKTTYNLAAAKDIPGDLAYGVVDTFLGLFPPYTVSFSAGIKRHHHPSMYVIKQFSAPTNELTYWADPKCGGNRHFITAWLDLRMTGVGVDPVFPPPSPLYGTAQTKKNVFTTLYFENKPYNTESDQATDSSSAKRMKVAKYYPNRYVYPPYPAVSVDRDGNKVTGVPEGRNFEFYMTADSLNVDSTVNEWRKREANGSLDAAWSAPPPSFVTASGRSLRAAMAPPLPARALPRALPFLAPDYRPLASLRAVA